MAEIGDWIYSVHEYEKVQGFVLEEVQGRRWVMVRVTTPPHMGVVAIPRRLAYKNNEICRGPDELLSLIDLALDLRDREWFEDLTHELSTWKAAENIFESMASCEQEKGT